jgi:uncharacterized protein (DUF1330 family)
MSVYVILAISVTNAEAYREYAAGAIKVVETAGGRYLTKTGDVQVVEGNFEADRVAIVEWPDVSTANAFYASAAYAPFKSIRHASAKTLCFNVPALPETMLTVSESRG